MYTISKYIYIYRHTYTRSKPLSSIVCAELARQVVLICIDGIQGSIGSGSVSVIGRDWCPSSNRFQSSIQL